MSTMLETRFSKARKRYWCTWCGEAILAKDTYARYTYVGDDGFGMCKMHPECYAAMEQEARAEGGWIEFGLSENDRPKTEGLRCQPSV